MRVLLIEDDPDVVSTIGSIFSMYYPKSEIFNIASGKDFAKGTWQSEGWDIVFLDLMLPGITGFDACHLLKQHDATKNVPILALTGYDTPTNRERILKAGATAYIAKPFDIQDILHTLRKCLNSKDSSGQ
jgi:DNA-binding response OmpR family regulator